jgi:hypothetical protein
VRYESVLPLYTQVPCVAHAVADIDFLDNLEVLLEFIFVRLNFIDLKAIRDYEPSVLFH